MTYRLTDLIAYGKESFTSAVRNLIAEKALVNSDHPPFQNFQ